jgi:hypothetical protein
MLVMILVMIAVTAAVMPANRFRTVVVMLMPIAVAPIIGVAPLGALVPLMVALPLLKVPSAGRQPALDHWMLLQDLNAKLFTRSLQNNYNRDSQSAPARRAGGNLYANLTESLKHPISLRAGLYVQGELIRLHGA